MRAREIEKAAGKAVSPKRFLKDSRGTTAIEFAVLALPFFLLVFAIIESCIAFAAQQVLANAVDNVARELRTGQIRPETLAPGQIQGMVCASIRIIVPQTCPNLFVDLEHYSTFTDAAAVRIPYTAAGGLDTSGFKIDPGGSGARNMLRVFYEWPLMTPLIGRLMANLPGNQELLFASVTWQNEPY
ncbi:MAG: pilus assembly protein [Rhizobiaceae bacterium]|nr:MAG: pilus assembly protein [Rhizobiaceae bacterium]